MMNLLYYFEEIVQKYPQKTAIACRETSYTFSELESLSRRLGQRIAECGMKNEPVAVFVNRGVDTAPLFLAVLFSGNYYIPIDPDMPEKKISMILEDCGARIVLCGDENCAVLRNLDYKGTVWTIEDAAAEPVCLPDTQGSAPAYMVYTSGSTGRPKGVLKSHSAVADFILTFSTHFQLGPEEIIGNQTPFFFDASAKDFYLMLMVGATLEVLPSELFIFPVTLVEYMNQRKVSYICWVPTALAIVTQMNTFKKLLPLYLKKVFFVGEVFPMKQLRKWMQTLPELQYVNLYGSSEIAGICCYYEIDTLDEDTQVIPMGQPLPNCQVFLMDDGQRVTEPGIIGEVYVVSPSLALEYYHDPVKTENTFVDMVMPDGSRARALKTGDLARYDEKGNLVFVSRKDFQIKHMGRRIELGEIEAAANTIPEIQRCCCLYDEKRKMIRLFCELAEGCGWEGKNVQSAMRGKLSDYMLPGRVTIMDRLPLNANGKIDRVKIREEM